MPSIHPFHIPVMGLAFTIDSPLKVAKFGISSVVSLVDDQLLEDMRRIHCKKNQVPYTAIEEHEEDFKARRTTAYLNLLKHLVDQQVSRLKTEPFDGESDICRYFELLPASHPYFLLYKKLEEIPVEERSAIEQELRDFVQPGSIDVNIMTKVDKLNEGKEGEMLPREFSDALSALRGFAQSDVNGSVVFSAGLNPSLYSYASQFQDFYLNDRGELPKQIILKVSDFRSALIQGKFLAKKGLWVSEFRIESGLNCGGHAFATDGFLAGPILQEFKDKRLELTETLFASCQQALVGMGKAELPVGIAPKITYQGGLGTSEEAKFLMHYYGLDGTGWGSPFLLVPEATSVDDDTLDRIIKAKESDFYLSAASPLGVPFNNLRTSSGEDQRKNRIAKDRPGSPCYKKFLVSNTEFTDKPICTASRQYQHLQVKANKEGSLPAAKLQAILEKDCLCEGLGAAALLSEGEMPRRNLSAVTICPGPNLTYFKQLYSLIEMVGHIYGKVKLPIDPNRPHVFVKELQLYIKYVQNELHASRNSLHPKNITYFKKFFDNLHGGIAYYRSLWEENQLGNFSMFEKCSATLDLLHSRFSSMIPEEAPI
ncbi:hypothetical protein [Pleomorphovibrio marinus]|uniref:hypothetical protein n=1 Tax=Pleomorphovibrio marinus TaxID=2164132 RepID=UPI001300BA86|nr:hypothetical protein [Pleomorphovibrio marinus]